ncbi:MAG: copper chaperone PCu(A)C [Gammaproteobacteria bacterium]|nr:copper chaperone PCu(A)C [Gammaproteobacteria bacterium]MCP5196422.1 copper chaperone PCu(A)C [Gammaproteobacteria bacterium]
MKTAMRGLLLVLCCISGMSALATEPETIQVTESWARESPPTVTNGAVYMTLTNTGSKNDRLLAGAGEIAEAIELHTHIMENHVAKMRQVTSIEIDAGKPTLLQPGGLHIMLIGLKNPLTVGQTFPLTLRFEKAGEIVTQVTVRGKDAEIAPGDSHAHHHHD